MSILPESTEHAKELEFLVCLSLPSLRESRLKRAEELSREGLDWSYLLSAAAFHGVVPSFAKHVRAHFQNEVPSKVLDQLNIRIKQIMTQNLALVGTFLRFHSELEKHGVKSAIFKGPTLAVVAYKDLLQREFNDVDLLVDPSDVSVTQKLLLNLGYKPLPERDPPLPESFFQSERFRILTTEHTFARELPAGLIDIHWEVQPTHLLPLTTKEVLASSVQVSLEGKLVRTIEPNLLFVVLAAHASKHAWDRLVWICDTAQLLENCPELDWRKVYEIADRLGVSEMVTLALLLSNRLFESNLPEPALKRKTKTNFLVDDIVKNLPSLILDGEGSRLRYLRYSIRLTSGIYGKIRFLIREIFQPTVPDVLRLRLPDSLFFMYFILHPFWFFYDAARRRFASSN